MDDWLPMDTAPHDETDVLLRRASPRGDVPPIAAGWFEKGTTPGWYSYDVEDEAILDANGWLPLPAWKGERA